MQMEQLIYELKGFNSNGNKSTEGESQAEEESSKATKSKTVKRGQQGYSSHKKPSNTSSFSTERKDSKTDPLRNQALLIR